MEEPINNQLLDDGNGYIELHIPSLEEHMEYLKAFKIKLRSLPKEKNYKTVALGKLIKKYTRLQNRLRSSVNISQHTEDEYLSKLYRDKNLIEMLFMETEGNDFFGLSMLFDSHERLDLFDYCNTMFTDIEYWRNLSDIYIQHNPKMRFLDKRFNKFLQSDRKERSSLMNDHELKIFNSLPEVITIYRGMSEKESRSKKYRLSWTLDKSIAEKFVRIIQDAHKFPCTVVCLRVPKSKIIAYLAGSNESEVIYVH